MMLIERIQRGGASTQVYRDPGKSEPSKVLYTVRITSSRRTKFNMAEGKKSVGCTGYSVASVICFSNAILRRAMKWQGGVTRMRCFRQGYLVRAVRLETGKNSVSLK